MNQLPPQCVDFAIFSPPFPSTFAYTDLAEDMGNSENLKHEAKLHFSFFFRQFARMLKPGRVAIVHCAQIGKLKRAGEQGLFDFRGMLQRLGERAGLIYEYDWMIRKNPQAQAIRTKKWELKFQGIETDRAMCRGTLCDYLLKFRAPGENKVKVCNTGEVTRETWIKWAEGCWDDILETDTLNTAVAKGENDTKHICPLQLEPIRRCVMLYTNPEEIVFSEMPLNIGDPPPLFTGVKTVAYSDSWETDKYIYIRQSSPLPCNVQMLMLFAETDND
jgi:hypothetical protein